MTAVPAREGASRAIGAPERTGTGSWTFDGFGGAFDEHVTAHLPHYRDVQDLVAHVSRYALPHGGTLADVGASTGATLDVISEVLPMREFTAHLYDSDRSMLDQVAHPLGVDVRLHHQDVTREPLAHRDADLTTALWVLQFLHPSARRPLLAALRARSAPSGVLLVAAKVRHPDARWQEVADGALADWKSAHGVTGDQQVAKTAALRGVLHADTTSALLGEVLAAGWASATVLFRWHAWVLIGAYATELREEET